MADILLRERVTVLFRTLDAVERVIEVLDESRTKADAIFTESRNAAARGVIPWLKALTESAKAAQFRNADNAANFMGAVAALETYLGALNQPTQEQPPTSRVSVQLEQLKGSVFESVGERRRELITLKKAIDDGLADEAARAKAWKACLDIEDDCQSLFADYLDLIRGIALRDSGLDGGLCRIADMLVEKELSFGTATWKSLTVPASRERRDTPGGIIRIGFPEWSVWTLPLTAVEFGSFAMARHEKTGNLHREATAKLQEIVAGGVAIPDHILAPLLERRALRVDPDGGATRTREALDRLTGMLLLEALGTVLMGPAYPWSALLTRIDPEPDQGLVERLRRDTVMGALRKLEVPDDQKAGPALLEREWKAFLDGVGVQAPDAFDTALAPVVTLVVDGVLERVSFRLRDNDWKLVTVLADELRTFPPGAQAVEAPDEQPADWHQGVSPGADVISTVSQKGYGPPTLRHVLNAGWEARLRRPDADDYQYVADAPIQSRESLLSRAVREVCVALLDSVSSTGGPTPGAHLTLPREQK